MGFGINLLTGNYEFGCLMYLSDEEFWARHGGACLPNWEADDMQTFSTADADGLRDMIADGRWTNEGLFVSPITQKALAQIRGSGSNSVITSRGSGNREDPTAQ